MLNFMLKAAARYVRVVGAINHCVGLAAMYILFVMMGILGYAVYANVVVESPAIWAMEMAQFSMAAYYILGGGYTLKDDSHVRMDVLYHRFGPRVRAILDSVTGVVLLFYLVVLVFGGVESTLYALAYSQKNFTAWAPPMAPIKIIMTTGMALMLAQGLAIWFQDLARAWGKELPVS